MRPSFREDGEACGNDSMPPPGFTDLMYKLLDDPTITRDDRNEIHRQLTALDAMTMHGVLMHWSQVPDYFFQNSAPVLEYSNRSYA